MVETLIKLYQKIFFFDSMVEIKLCDISIVEDNTVRQSTRAGSMRTGKRIHICDEHRKRFRELNPLSMAKMIQDSKDKVRFVLSQQKHIGDDDMVITQ